MRQVDIVGINPTTTNSAQETLPATARSAAQAQVMQPRTQPAAPSASGEQAATAGSSATKAASALQPSPKQVCGCLCCLCLLGGVLQRCAPQQASLRYGFGLKPLRNPASKHACCSQ